MLLTGRRITSVILRAALVAGILAGGISGGPFAPAAPEHPLRVDIEAQKQIYTRREGVMVRFVLTALAPVRLCLEKDPLVQLRLKIARGGSGGLPLEPLVVEDTRELYRQPLRVVEMKPGDRQFFRLNLKRLRFADGEQWAPGDYTVSASFNLCDQTAPDAPDGTVGPERAIPARGSARFMIMN